MYHQLKSVNLLAIELFRQNGVLLFIEFKILACTWTKNDSHFDWLVLFVKVPGNNKTEVFQAIFTVKLIVLKRLE